MLKLDFISKLTPQMIALRLCLNFYFIKHSMLMALITLATEHYYFPIKLSPFGILRIIAVGIFLSICDVILIKGGFILIACDSPFFCCQRIILRFDVWFADTQLCFWCARMVPIITTDRWKFIVEHGFFFRSFWKVIRFK